MQTVLSLFRECDVDQSGVIDLEEFQVMLFKMDVPLTDTELTAAFMVIDEDGDGFLQYAELVAAIQAYDRLELMHLVKGQNQPRQSQFTFKASPEDVPVAEEAVVLPKEDFKYQVADKPAEETPKKPEVKRERKLMKGQIKGTINPEHPDIARFTGIDESQETPASTSPSQSRAPLPNMGNEDQYCVQMYPDTIDKLRSIFDFYCTIGFKPGMYRKLRMGQFLKVLNDCELISDRESQEDAKILFVESTTIKEDDGNRLKQSLMTFEMFMYAISQLAVKAEDPELDMAEAVDNFCEAHVYPNAETKPDPLASGGGGSTNEDGEEAELSQREIDAILIAAWKGSESSAQMLREKGIQGDKAGPAIDSCFKMFEPALRTIFQQYMGRGTRSADAETNWPWLERQQRIMDRDEVMAMVNDFGILGRVSESQLDFIFRTCCEVFAEHTDTDKLSYYGDEHPDAISFDAFPEFLYRCALAMGAHPPFLSMSPPQKLDILLNTMAASKGCKLLEVALHGTAAGTNLHAMITHCIKSVMQNKDPEVHVFDIADVKAALGAEGVQYAHRIFDFYASFGQPTRIDVMSSGKFEKFCRDIRLYKILDDKVPGEERAPGEVTIIAVDICFKNCMLSAPQQSDSPAKRKSLPAAGAFNGVVDFEGFLMLISQLATLKFPKAKGEDKSLCLLWEVHIVPYAKPGPDKSPAEVSGEEDEANLTSTNVTKLFQRVHKQLTAFFKKYALPGQGAEYFMTRDSLMKMTRDFEILPKLVSHREVAKVLQGAEIRSAGGRNNNPKVSYEQYIYVLGRIALIAFGKSPHCNRHTTALQRVEALIIYLDMSEGRLKMGIKSDAWVTQQLEKNEALKGKKPSK